MCLLGNENQEVVTKRVVSTNAYRQVAARLQKLVSSLGVDIDISTLEQLQQQSALPKPLTANIGFQCGSKLPLTLSRVGQSCKSKPSMMNAGTLQDVVCFSESGVGLRSRFGR